MWPIDCIEHKRDGKVLTKEEISRFITDYTAGRVADYQAAAWLMAVYFQGMAAGSEDEAHPPEFFKISGRNGPVQITPFRGYRCGGPVSYN